MGQLFCREEDSRAEFLRPLRIKKAKGWQKSHSILLSNKKPMIKEEEKLNQDYQARVLSVDDEPMNLLVLESLLKLNNFKGESCASGYRALKLVRDRVKNNIPLYDIIFMDYSMPGLDGLQTTVEIRKICKKHKIQASPKIICLTAYTDLEYRRRALESGMDDFMTKPITNDSLKEILSRFP